MTHKDRESTITYIQGLIEQQEEQKDFNLPFYNLKRLLDLNDITIKELIFSESKKPNSTVLSCSSFNKLTNSVNLVVSEKSWIEYLPSIYKDNKDLKGFLYGIQVSMFKQREIVDHIENIFIPRKSEFLDWLASWYGVGFSESVESDSKRELIYKLIELYKKRGTKAYLIEIVKILTGANIEIEERKFPSFLENDNLFREDINLKIMFTVKLTDDFSNKEEEERLLIRRIRNIIDFEKPAFTRYYIDSDLIKKEKIVTGIDEGTKEPKILFDDNEEREQEVNHYQHEQEILNEELEDDSDKDVGLFR